MRTISTTARAIGKAATSCRQCAYLQSQLSVSAYKTPVRWLSHKANSPPFSVANKINIPGDVQELNKTLKSLLGVQQPNFGMALRYFRHSQKAGISPNSTSLGLASKKCLQSPNRSSYLLALEVYETLKTQNAKMRSRDCGTMINICSKQNPPQIEVALGIVRNMSQEGVRIPPRSATSLILACGREETRLMNSSKYDTPFQKRNQGGGTNSAFDRLSPLSTNLAAREAPLEQLWLELQQQTRHLEHHHVRHALAVFDMISAQGKVL